MSAPNLRSTLKPLTPHRERPEALDARTVGRDDVLAALHRRFRAAATSSNRTHTLLIGPRGAGKSHVISVALHRLRLDPDLNGALAVARVEEDVVGLRTYADLLVEVLRALGAPAAAVTAAKRDRRPAELERQVLEELGTRTMVLVIENLSRLFDQIGKDGQQNLRSFVETTGRILVLASTPLLTASVADRSEPWFGSFTPEHLGELTLDEGTALLREVATAEGDQEFIDFIESPRGASRLAALHHLAGGSPRLWVVFAGCASKQALDDLVPAVEQLLEQMTAYFQQLLWDLSPVEAALVAELGRGQVSAPASEVAAAAGVDVDTAATTLRRLEASRWVRGEKVPGTDQRTTWYRLREPLLRHHFQYRQDDGQPLSLIVEILRAWFSVADRDERLAEVGPGSESERHLLAAMRLDPPRRSDTGWANADPAELLAEARRWIDGLGDIGDRNTGIVIEALVIGQREGPAAAQDVLRARHAPPELPAAVEGALAASHTLGDALDRLADQPPPSTDGRLVTLVNACWTARDDPATAADRIRAIATDGESSVDLAIRDELAFWTGEAGDHLAAADLARSLVSDRSRILGPDHPDTLNARHQLGYQVGKSGDHSGAVGLLRKLVEDSTEMLGQDHLDTLAVRLGHAHLVGAAGDHTRAANLVREIIGDHTSILGPDHPYTLDARHQLADHVANSGDHNQAADLLHQLIDDCTRVLGPDHRDTLHARIDHAADLAYTGQIERALTETLEAIARLSRFTYPNAPRLSRARTNAANMLRTPSDPAPKVVAIVRFIDQAPEPDPWAEGQLGDLLVDLVQRGLPLPPLETLGSAGPTLHPLFKLMEDARDGSGEAAAKLPAELRSLVVPET